MYLIYGLVNRFSDFQIGPGLECQYIKFPSVKQEEVSLNLYEPPHGKTNKVVSEQV